MGLPNEWFLLVGGSRWGREGEQAPRGAGGGTWGVPGAGREAGGAENGWAGGWGGVSVGLPNEWFLLVGESL